MRLYARENRLVANYEDCLYSTSYFMRNNETYTPIAIDTIETTRTGVLVAESASYLDKKNSVASIIEAPKADATFGTAFDL